MNLSKTFKKLLLEEIELIIDKMDSSSSPAEVAYYFSAVPGVIQRIFNFEFHPELVHLWVILNSLSQGVGQIFTQLSQHFEASNPIRLKKMIGLVKRLRDAIQKDKEIKDILQDFAVLLYSTNGNGNFLVQKGTLNLEDI